MEVYDPKSLISALEYSNEQRGLLIEKIIRENVELKERLVSTQRVPDTEKKRKCDEGTVGD